MIQHTSDFLEFIQEHYYGPVYEILILIAYAPNLAKMYQINAHADVSRVPRGITFGGTGGPDP